MSMIKKYSRYNGTLHYEKKNSEIKSLELYPVGVAFGTYIVAENTEGIF